MAAVLIVDDEASLRTTVEIGLKREGHTVLQAGSCSEAQRMLARSVVDLVLCDVRLPDGSGLSVLEQIQKTAPAVAAIVMTAYGTVDLAVEAMKLGAIDFLEKPFGPERLVTCVESALRRARLAAELGRRSARGSKALAGFVGESAEVQEVRRLVERSKLADCILITGETGTGKGLLARAVHDAAFPEADAPFVIVDCGSLPESLIENELFGHVRGAFTGADSTRKGLIAEADGGSVFLDEIGEMPLATQVKLLRFIESREVRSVGADNTRLIKCRVIAATHRDLEADVEAGRFRADLLYRLDVLRIHTPTLRDRPEDIPLLVEQLLRRKEARLKLAPRTVSDRALELLQEYSWPGNVRELEHAIERALLVGEGELIEIDDLLSSQKRGAAATPPTSAARAHESAPDPEEQPPRPLSEVEKDHILRVLDNVGGDRKRAAEALEISRSTLRRKLISYGLWTSDS